MPSGVWPLEGFHSHNHLLCISNIPSQAATLLHHQTTVRNCLCSKTRPKAQNSAQARVSMHTQSCIRRQKLCHVQKKLQRSNEQPCNTTQINPCNSLLAVLHSPCCIPSFPFQAEAAFRIPMQNDHSCYYISVNKIAPACLQTCQMYLVMCV